MNTNQPGLFVTSWVVFGFFLSFLYGNPPSLERPVDAAQGREGKEKF